MANALVVLSALSVLAGCGGGDTERIELGPGDFPLRFVRTETVPIRRLYFDLNRDGRNEYVESTMDAKAKTASLIVHAPDGSMVDQINFFGAENIQPWAAADVNGDGDAEVFLTGLRHDTLFAFIVDVYHAKHSTLFRTIPLFWSSPRAGGASAAEVQARIWGVLPLDGGKRPVMITSLTCGFPLRPREVDAYEILSGKRLWSVPLGAPVGTIVFEHPAADSLPSVFIGTGAPDNGADTNGTNDSHSYVIALTGTGKRAWMREMGGPFSTSMVALADLEGDGQRELVACFVPGTGGSERFALVGMHTLNGGQVARREFSDAMASFTRFGPLARNERWQRFAVATRSGRVTLLASDFSLLREKQIEGQVHHMTVAERDGEEELVTTLDDGATLILKPDLEAVAYLPAELAPGGIDEIAQARRPDEGRQFVAYGGGNSTVIGYLEANPARERRWLLLFGNIAAAAVILGTVGYLGFQGFVYLQVYRSFSRWNKQVGLLLLNRMGKLIQLNEGCRKMLGIDYDVKKGAVWSTVFRDGPIRLFFSRALSQTGAVEERLDLTVDRQTVNLLVRCLPVMAGRFRLGTLVVIGDLTESLRADRMLNWAAVAQNLAHEMKTPLSTIRFTLERIRQSFRERGSTPVEGHLASIEEEVFRLDQYVRGFLKLANLNPPALQPTDINAVLASRLAEYGERMPGSVRVVTEYAEHLPAVELDVNLCTIAITNLVDNAVAAMKGVGELRISTYLAQNLNREEVCCAVSDTGCGIPEADWPKLFEPYFSKSPAGTGLGLVITKKIVEDHGGKITFRSRVGLGTEFVIHLPARGASGGGLHA